MHSRYFHALVRCRRKRLHIHNIQDEEGNWYQRYEEIANAACNHFQHMFSGEETFIQDQALQCIHHMVTADQNDML